MFNDLKFGARRLLLDHGIWIGRATPEKKVLDFLDSVKPRKTNYEMIRIGGESDGGYLVPDDLAGIDTCFSPGVSRIANFENELTTRGIKCFLADYSVESPPIDNPLFDFEKKYLGAESNDIYMTLEQWIAAKAPHKSDFILQMDIEGYEYPVILDTSVNTLEKFRILVFEFHGLEHVFDPMGYELISLAFSKLLRSFDVVHIHPNNYCRPIRCGDIEIPPLLEFTFLRRDRIERSTRATSFPHHLDRANVPSMPDFALPACWYK